VVQAAPRLPHASHDVRHRLVGSSTMSQRLSYAYAYMGAYVTDMPHAHVHAIAMCRSSVAQASAGIRLRPPINPAAPQPNPGPCAPGRHLREAENHDHFAHLRPAATVPGLEPAAAGPVASCSRPAAARPLPVQARAERGPGPWRHQHRQRREGRPRQLGTSPIYSRCRRMGRARTTQDKTRAGAHEPMQTRQANRTTPVSLFQFRVNIHGVAGS